VSRARVTGDKVYAGVVEALAGLLRDGMSIMSGGFGLCGNAEACIDAIAASGVKNLTIISNNCGNQGQGLAVLLQHGQVARVICSFVGGNPDLAEQFLSGRVKVELVPQGTFAERIRAVSGEGPTGSAVAACCGCCRSQLCSSAWSKCAGTEMPPTLTDVGCGRPA